MTLNKRRLLDIYCFSDSLKVSSKCAVLPNKRGPIIYAYFVWIRKDHSEAFMTAFVIAFNAFQGFVVREQMWFGSKLTQAKRRV